jgi:hypothetical protein
MGDWVEECGVVIEQVSILGLPASELVSAVQSGDPDAAVTALGPLMLMIEGAWLVLGVGLPKWGETGFARDQAAKAFQACLEASGAVFDEKDAVCSIP